MGDGRERPVDDKDMSKVKRPPMALAKPSLTSNYQLRRSS
jgi:hypothetical protein